MSLKLLIAHVATVLALILGIGALAAPAMATPAPAPVAAARVVAASAPVRPVFYPDYPFGDSSPAPSPNQQVTPNVPSSPFPPGTIEGVIELVREGFRCVLATFSSDLDCEL